MFRGPVSRYRGRQAEVPQLPRPLPRQAEDQVRAGDQLRGQDQNQVQLLRPRAVSNVPIRQRHTRGTHNSQIFISLHNKVIEIPFNAIHIFLCFNDKVVVSIVANLYTEFLFL